MIGNSLAKKNIPQLQVIFLELSHGPQDADAIVMSPGMTLHFHGLGDPEVNLNLYLPLEILGWGIYLGGGFKYFLFSSLFGEDSHFD